MPEHGVVRLVYSLFLYLLLPLILLRVLWRSVKAPAYRQRLGERFGFGAPRLKNAIWVHAVSVGETLAAQPLVNALLKTYPDRPLLVTTMTPTGSERVRALWGERVHHVYAPWDMPDAVARFTRAVNPSVLVIMETELWPNLLAGAKRSGARVLLANARLSERSACGYARASWLTKGLMESLDVVAAQDKATANRFMALGLPAAAVQVTGSIKFDIAVPEALRTEAGLLRQAWRADHRPVWVAASTHRGEDEQVIAAHQSLMKKLSDALLILVPRHPERFDEVAALLQREGLGFCRRSRNEQPDDHTTVFLADSMGELLRWYAMSDVAFVGGSLVPVGGHNMLEPLALGVAALSGPHVFNFQSIADELLAEQALVLVDDAEALALAVAELMGAPEKKTRQEQAGLQVLHRNRGALERQLTLVSRLLGN